MLSEFGTNIILVNLVPRTPSIVNLSIGRYLGNVGSTYRVPTIERETIDPLGGFQLKVPTFEIEMCILGNYPK